MDEWGLLKNIADAPKVAPMQPWALQLYKERQQRFLRDDPMYLNCKPPGGPRQFQLAYGVQFVEDRVRQRIFVLIGSGNNNYRIIYTDGRSHQGQVGGDDENPLFYGRAVGKWEGDTLAIDTRGFNEDFWFTNGGLPHTDQLKLDRKDFPSEPRHAQVRSDGGRPRRVHAAVVGELDAAVGGGQGDAPAFVSGESIMKMKAFVLGGLFAVRRAVAGAPVSAHHSFAAEFDADKPITLTGIVTKVEWTNPHVWFYINVKDEKTGEVTNWGAEMGPPHGLQRRGWRQNTLKIGDAVTVAGFDGEERRQADERQQGDADVDRRASGRDPRRRFQRERER